VVVTHELPSILTIGNNSVYLDTDTRTMISTGNPREAIHSGTAIVRRFLSRGAA
jgi:phospholipid/cholesterol/gamma-HCH transport system ATP-binding protein